LKAAERNLVFDELLKEEKITELIVEGCKERFYCISEDRALVQEVLEGSPYKGRTELIAALDNMLWDRKLIKELFGFDYKWEIYTPQEQRKYGYYVLPVLRGEQFLGRCEVISDSKQKALVIKNVWLEPGIKPTKKLMEEFDKCFRRFMKFHELKEMIYSNEIYW
jgi:uncharacterized protein YcaQ